MEQRKRLRPRTEREKERDQKPDCLWDPLNIHWCNHYEFPPPKEVCKICITRSFADATEDRIGSEAMRYFLEYRRFVDEYYVEKNEKSRKETTAK